MTMSPKRATMRAIVIAACCTLFALQSVSAVWAQTNYYWDPLLHATADGGTGTWDNVTNNWRSPTIAGGLTNWSPGMDDSIANMAAKSGNTSDTISLGANISANVLNFTNVGGAYTYTILPATSTTNNLTFVGTSPTINLTDGTGAITASFTANAIPTTQLQALDLDTAAGRGPIRNFNGRG